MLTVDSDGPAVSEDLFFRAAITASVAGSSDQFGNTWQPASQAGGVLTTVDPAGPRVLPPSAGLFGAARVPIPMADGVANFRARAPGTAISATHVMGIFRLEAQACSLFHAQLYSSPSGVLALRRLRNTTNTLLASVACPSLIVNGNFNRTVNLQLRARGNMLSATVDREGGLPLRLAEVSASHAALPLEQGEWGIQMMLASSAVVEAQVGHAWSLHTAMGASAPAPGDSYNFDGVDDSVHRSASDGGLARDLVGETRNHVPRMPVPTAYVAVIVAPLGGSANGVFDVSVAGRERFRFAR